MIRDFNQFMRADKKGYVIIPRRLLETMYFGKTASERLEAKMYVFFLFSACYAEVDDAGGGGETLQRGELVFSYKDLSKRFGVARLTVARFVERLREAGVIEISPFGRSCKSRMKLLFYDNLCRFTDRTPGGKVRTRKADEDFIFFWDRYHSMTGLPEVEIETARRNWNRLTAAERKLAVDNVAAYVCTQSYDRLRTAANYLAHKSFYV